MIIYYSEKININGIIEEFYENFSDPLFYRTTVSFADGLKRIVYATKKNYVVLYYYRNHQEKFNIIYSGLV